MMLVSLLGCRGETTTAAEPSDAVALEVVVPPSTATVTSTIVRAATATVSREAVPARAADPDRAAAELARVKLVGMRRAVAADVAASAAEINGLERTLRKIGPRNERIHLLEKLGQARERYATRQQIERRCDEAFDGVLGVELEETWALTEELGPDEAEAARDAYRRYILQAADMHQACGPLEPIETTKGRKIGVQ